MTGWRSVRCSLARHKRLTFTGVVTLALAISLTGVVAGAAGGFALARLATNFLQVVRTPGMLVQR